MGRPARQIPASNLIKGGIFSQRERANSKSRPQPAFAERLNDYRQLIGDLTVSFTAAVDRSFPNADFLATQPGSHISPDTKLSVVLRACYGLSQMKLPAELVMNYQRTVTEYMKSIQHDPSKKEEYATLRNILHTYKSLSSAMQNQTLMSNELTRLKELGLPPKTIDRRLKTEWADSCIKQPIADITANVAKTMRSSEALQSDDLAGRSNSLASLARLVDMPAQTSAEKEVEKPQGFTPSMGATAAPAA